MKKLSAVLLVLIAVAALCAFGPAPASAASSELVIYCPHPLTFITPLVEAFQKQSGIKTEVITAGSGELLKRVEAEQANLSKLLSAEAVVDARRHVVIVVELARCPNVRVKLGGLA